MPVDTGNITVKGPIDYGAQWVGKVSYPFFDGRIIKRELRAATEVDFDARVISMIPKVEEYQKIQDAEIVNEEDISDSGNAEASTLDTMVSKLRYAYEQPVPENFYRNMKQIDDYRNGKSWSWNDVRDAIIAVPEYEYTNEEWTNQQDRWEYLDTNPKINIMQNYNQLLVGDTWGAEFRNV